MRRGIHEGESFVQLSNGKAVAFPSAEIEPDGVSYVRVIDAKGKEVAYWESTEWTESKEQGKEVMGALMGAMKG